ncbi:MAG: hypothetical protein ABR551_07360 [Gemmatimonadales bacterium]
MPIGFRATAAWAPAGLLFLALGAPASAQQSQTNTVTAVVPSLGAVLAISQLTPGNRLPGGDLFVHGTVTTRHNGPYQLQTRLTEPFSPPGGGTHSVQARTPGGSLATLGTSEWVTIGTGPGGTGLVNPVEFLVVWGQAGPRNPGTAVQIPVEYRVVPP